MLSIACNCPELIRLIMYKQILSECISKTFSGTSFRGTHGKEHTLISNSAIVEVLLTQITAIISLSVLSGLCQM